MKDLQTNFSLIKPEILNKDQDFQVWFTLKNENYSKTEQSIPGLNLGFNTSESKEVVAQNRLALFENLGLDQQWVAYANQVHSNRIQLVTEGGIYPTTDGLVTLIPGLTLAIQVADCAAVLLWDSSNNIIGALHAGWRGAVGDIIPRGIEKMKKQGANPQTIKAFVSPCISLKNFEVGMEVAEKFPDDFVDYESYEKPHVDLKKFLNHQLRAVKIPKPQIEIHEECTIENAQDFYSYRREGEQSGRMMALIQMAE